MVSNIGEVILQSERRNQCPLDNTDKTSKLRYRQLTECVRTCSRHFKQHRCFAY